MKNKVVITKEHAHTKELFPIGFETTYRKVYTEEDKIYKGYDKLVNKKVVYVPDRVIPKGTFIDCYFLAKNGKEYSGDWFYKFTGKSFTEFMTKI